jgi:hypothetical protein
MKKNDNMLVVTLCIVFLMPLTTFGSQSPQGLSDWMEHNSFKDKNYVRTVLVGVVIVGLGYGAYKLYQVYKSYQRAKIDLLLLEEKLGINKTTISDSLQFHAKNIATILDSKNLSDDHRKLLFQKNICPVLSHNFQHLQSENGWNDFLLVLLPNSERRSEPRSEDIDRLYLTKILNLTVEVCPAAPFYDSLEKKLLNMIKK